MNFYHFDNRTNALGANIVLLTMLHFVTSQN